MNDLENTTIRCHNRFMRKRLAGEKYHDSPKECFSEHYDTEGYCRGAVYGQSCSNNGDADCDVDLYCSERKVCEHAKLEGEHCNAVDKCASYLLCSWEDGYDYKCRPYGYHSNGDTLGPGDEDDICRSRYLNDEAVCEKGPRLTHSNIRDMPGEKCTYTHGPNDLARCFYHHEGKAICRKGAGDMEKDWNTVLEYLRKRPKCHVTIPLAQCDMGALVYTDKTEWEKLWFTLSEIHWEAQLEGLLPCMHRFVHPEAFKYGEKKSYGSFLTASLASIIAILFLLI